MYQNVPNSLGANEKLYMCHLHYTRPFTFDGPLKSL